MADQEITRVLADYIVSEIAGRPVDGALTPDFPIIERGVVDSLGLFKLIAFAEEKFQIRIAPEEILFENFATLHAFADLIRSKQPPQDTRKC